MEQINLNLSWSLQIVYSVSTTAKTLCNQKAPEVIFSFILKQFQHHLSQKILIIVPLLKFNLHKH